jgi:hypothetical protein
MERTGYSCPACKRETGDTNEVLAGGGYLACSKIGTHRWNDLEVFMNEGPKIEFKMQKQPAAPQSNHTSLNVSISVPLYNDLLAKYGDKVNAVVAGALKVIVEGEQIIISAEEVEELKRVLPEKPKNARHLAGLIYAIDQQRIEAKSIADAASESLKGYEGLQPTKVLVDLGANMEYARGRAAEEKQPVSLWLSINLKNALDSQWF